MTDAVRFRSLNGSTRLGAARNGEISRPALCLLVAVVEGLAGTALQLTVTIAYSLFFLDMTLETFNWGLYGAVSTGLGILHATFSAHAAARFLDGERRLNTMLRWALFSWTAAFAATLMIAFLGGLIGALSRVSLTATYLIGIPVILTLSRVLQTVLSNRIAAGELRYLKIAVMGERIHVLDFLLRGNLWRHGHTIAGTLYLEDALIDGVLQPDAIAGFAANALRNRASSVVIVGELSKFGAYDDVTSELKRFAMDVVYAPVASGNGLQVIDVVRVGNTRTLRVLRRPLDTTAIIAKRAIDAVGSLAGLVLLSPLLLFVAVAIKLDSPGPVIFRQARRGFNGETFMIAKFRSMTVMEDGASMSQAKLGDARITRVGRIIRALSIDELPQLLNVFSGEMSLVGPRPHALSHDDTLARQLEDYAHRRRIKPGITGWAQINGFRGDTSTFEKINGRTQHDLYYIENWSFFLDLWIILLTVFSKNTRMNAY